jgi:hypothetical protein
LLRWWSSISRWYLWMSLRRSSIFDTVVFFLFSMVFISFHCVSMLFISLQYPWRLSIFHWFFLWFSPICPWFLLKTAETSQNNRKIDSKTKAKSQKPSLQTKKR